jgi:transglutaminase-like putative cysteine protease
LPSLNGSQPKTIVDERYGGAPQTVAYIRKAVLDAQYKPEVRALAEELTKHLPSKDTVSEALAYYYFALDRCRYMRDPRSVERVQAPWIIIQQLMAGHTPGIDCDEYAALLCALAAVSGAECRVVTVAFANMFYRGRRQYSHVFAQVKEPRTSRWVTLDPVAGDKTGQMRGRVVALKIWPIV